MSKMNLFNKVKALFADEDSIDSGEVTNVEDVTVDVKTDDERILRVISKDIEVEAEIKEVTEEGIIDLENGTYKLVDGTELTVEDSKIKAIKEIEEDGTTETEEAPEDVSFKATKYSVDGFAVIKEIWTYELKVNEEDFKIGTQVTVTYTDYDGDEQTYNMYGGTYQLEDKRWIVLDENGIVILVKDAEGNVLESPEVGSNLEDGEHAPIESETELEDENKEDKEKENDEIDEEEFSKMVETLTENFTKLQNEYNELQKEFEAFKKSPSVTHTDVKDTLKFNETPTKLSKLKAQLGKY